MGCRLYANLRRSPLRHCFSSNACNASNVDYNEFNIQLLPRDLHARIFPKKSPPPPPSILAIAKQHLASHDIPFEQKRSALPPLPSDKVSLLTPELTGLDLADHFYKLGVYASQPWTDLAKSAEAFDLQAHSIPGEFSAEPGWTFYGAAGGEPRRMADAPGESFLFFDTESCWSLSKFPLFAVALGPSGWYSWTSPLVLDGKAEAVLIPLGMPTKPQLVIGHNVSYDRIQIAEEYSIDLSMRRFVDTMSLHCAVAGLSSQQRPMWNESKRGEPGGSGMASWKDASAMNNLVDALKLHANAELDKSDLKLLINADQQSIFANRHKILQYCARDVLASATLFQAVWRRYSQHCPHPVSQAGMLMMGSMILPVDRTWAEYLEKCEHMYKESIAEGEKILSELAEAIAEATSPEDARADFWLNQLDWTPVPPKYTAVKKKPVGDERLFGKPAWFKKLFVRSSGRCRVTIKSSVTPLLLKLTWRGFPVTNVDDEGWCYLVPLAEKSREAEQVGHKKFVKELNGSAVFRIPHTTDEDAHVGSMFSKGFSKAIDQGILSSRSPEVLARLLSLSSRWSFWTGYRERLTKQLAVFPTDTFGFIVPATVVMGTVTRRAVEGTWMTAGNPKKGSAGSEQKAMIRSPPGWLFVGADVDSQELWIASLLGDAAFSEHGSTAMGWMTLQGSRQDSTDLHSRTAAILGMKRDDAKIFTYGRIYGAGVKYAATLLARFNPKMSLAEAKDKASDLYARTKGKKAMDVYIGGSESFMFNQLEKIAGNHDARTPVLGCRISEALSKEHVGREFMTSRVNWAVQSSAVDYLHLMLVSMQFLLDVYKIPARLAITIHDEVRFLVKEGHELRAALALQISNLWVRAMFAQQLGISDLPFSVAFFSLVDVDRVLRKEPMADCVTPTNPVPIPPGKSLTVYQLLEAIGHSGLGRPDDRLLDAIKRVHVPPQQRAFAPHSENWEKSLWSQIGPKGPPTGISKDPERAKESTSRTPAAAHPKPCDKTAKPGKPQNTLSSLVEERYHNLLCSGIAT